jgi:8-oxo-dGTP pyrophosphatase MutT (NUDIX family)
MPVRRPHPSEEWDPGAETPARPAASVIVIRESPEGPEVLLVQRTPKARFMGGAWVFPGGAVDRAEGSGREALEAAALRELQEEAGVRLAGAELLMPFSRWITPPEVKIRFDTWFFLAALPDGEEPRVDGAEVVDLRWYEPAAALAAGELDELLLVFPTIKHLEQLSGFRSVNELILHARGREVRPVEPRVLLSGETARIVLPGEPGYES